MLNVLIVIILIALILFVLNFYLAGKVKERQTQAEKELVMLRVDKLTLDFFSSMPITQNADELETALNTFYTNNALAPNIDCSKTNKITCSGNLRSDWNVVLGTTYHKKFYLPTNKPEILQEIELNALLIKALPKEFI